ncbi:MAG TPA: PQQ-dependent sugar dehydrogenase [Burkholderiales bacterium]|nr:PQQ-dependent sugar dehydrogenase [Burkholderiales bacterium]
MRSPRLAAAAVLSLVCALANPLRAQSSSPLLTPIVQASTFQPIFVSDPGDGRLFVVERAGYIRIFANGAFQDEGSAFLDIHGVVDTTGEGGLTSMAFDPDFASNRFIYVMYTRDIDPSSDVLLQSVVARYTVSNADPNHVDGASAKELLTLDAPGTAYTNHKGGQLQFGPDDMLYIGFGDGGSANDPGCRAQTRNVFFGKILRIDPHGTGFGVGGVGYGIPADNPFPTGTDANDPNNYRPEIWLMGLRNPWRFSFDRSTGDLWIGDVGQGAREEIDLLAPNTVTSEKNYGWNVVEGDVAGPGPNGNCPTYVKKKNDPNANYIAPIFAYPHPAGVPISITGGYVYRGSVAAWNGRYLYADYETGEVHYLQKNDASWDSTEIPNLGLSGPASFGEDSSGELYIADLNTGWVYRFNFGAAVALSKAEVACVSDLNVGFRKLADTGGKFLKSCFGKAQNGTLSIGTVENCTSSPKLAKLYDKTTAVDQKRCGAVPGFGYAGSDAGNNASALADLDAGIRVLGQGDSLAAAVVPRSQDKSAAACQKAVLAGVLACQQARRAEFVRCKKVRLKKATILNAAQLAACLDSDPKGEVAKVCDGTTGKLATKTIEKSCVVPGVDLPTLFPNCGADTSAGLAQCVDDATACRTCQMFRDADALAADICDDVCALP